MENNIKGAYSEYNQQVDTQFKETLNSPEY